MLNSQNRHTAYLAGSPLLLLTTPWLLLLAAAAASPAEDGASRPRPNVLLIVTDDQRPDTISALGNPLIRTPTLDQLVCRGSIFTRAICPNPICTPSRSEILTGCSSMRNGAVDFGGKIDPDLVPLARALDQAGYLTCYVGKWHNNGRPSDFGYQQTRGLFTGGGGRWWKPQVDHHGREVTGYRGWVFQDSDGTKFPELGVGLTADISAKFADAAIQLIQERPQQPFFLHVNFTAPHDPLLMPPGFERQYDPADVPLPPNFAARHPFDHGNFDGRDERLLPWPRTPSDVREDLAVYYAVISHMDQQLGRILKAVDATGQRQETLVIFTSDHGLAMGSHGLRGKQNMYEHTVGVPLILAGPGVPSGKRFASQVYLRDIYPTICDLTGVPTPDTVQARSMAPILRGDAAGIHDAVFGHFRSVQRMIRTDRWKLIYYPHLDRYQLFDLKKDPFEKDDRVGRAAHAEIQQQLKDRLERWRQEIGDPLVTQAAP